MTTAGDRATPVSAAMLRNPKVHRPDTTVAELIEAFASPHMQSALITDAAGRLLTIVDRPDLDGVAPSARPATDLGTLTERTIAPDADLARTHRAMVAAGQRRLAVVGPDGALLGLLALKRSTKGFCTDDRSCARDAPTWPLTTERAVTDTNAE